MSGRKFILYVDDDLDDLALLEDSFKGMDEYQLVCLKNGIDLFKFLDLVTNVSLIILDINMPELNGIDILLELKTIEKYRQIPVVMLCTARNPKENLTVRGLGSAIILKPTSYTETLTLANRLLEYCK